MSAGTCRRCYKCDIDWPDLMKYHLCPDCLKQTKLEMWSGIPQSEAVTLEAQANRRREAHALFEKYIEERDAPMIDAAVKELHTELTLCGPALFLPEQDENFGLAG